MRISSDDRRLGYFNLFPTPGDLNVIRLRPGALSAWHRHEKQDDHFFCALGAVKVGIVFGDAPVWHTLDAHNPSVVSVPAGAWHGYQNLAAGESILVMYATQKYDGTDEQRRSIEEMGISWDRQPR